jgi:hypothetical protein
MKLPDGAHLFRHVPTQLSTTFDFFHLHLRAAECVSVGIMVIAIFSRIEAEHQISRLSILTKWIQ